MRTDGTEPGAAAAPPAAAPPATARDAGAAPPVAGNSPATATPPAPEPPATATRAQPRPPSPDQAHIAVLMRRGDALLAIGDISGARRFYERAAEAGSAEAAMAAGRTHDPAALASLGVRGMRPDPEAAAAWYRRAEALQAAQRDATPQHGAAR
jgi:TPR repeat protein